MQALGSGQLDHRAAGKMLYGIQMTISFNRRMAKAEAAANQPESGPPHKPDSGLCGSFPHNDEVSGMACAEPGRMVQEYPQFEQEFGLKPGEDIDAAIAWTLSKADEEMELRQADVLPPPPGMSLSPAQFRVYREEAYQMLNVRVNRQRQELRGYYEMKRKESENLRQEFENARKEMQSATPPLEPVAGTA